MSYYLVLDIGGTNIKYGILNQAGDILTKNSFPTQDDKSEILQAITALVEQYHSVYPLEGIAISAPGMIDADRGYFVTAGAIQSLYHVELKKELHLLTGLNVEMENDVNCVALAERWLGKGAEVKDFICLAIGTGIGGAIVLDGKLYRGHRHMAGEFGFMLSKHIDGTDTSRATLSNTASTRGGIIQAYQELSATLLSGEDIYQLYLNGDPIAKTVITGFIDNLAIGLYNLIFAFDPQKVLLGGAISSNSDLMADVVSRVKQLVSQHPYLSGVDLPIIDTCQFNNDSGLIGALYNYLLRSKW
jgi:predicted NBD/HSP70 family sugar kinase